MSSSQRAIRTLIVDDEPVARDLIRIRLERESDFEIVGEAGDGESAVAAIRAELPDLVLLDIQMPGMTGFQVLDHVGPEHLPHVVFVTAFNHFALRAFDAHAVDYLVKPVDQARWLAALDRARLFVHGDNDEQRQRVANMLSTMQAREAEDTGAVKETVPNAGDGRRYIRRFVVRENDRIFLVPAGEVDWLESAGNYVRVNARSRSYRIRATMASLENSLDPDQFARVHRRAIVNIERIAEIHPSFHGDFNVRLRDGTVVRMSREFRSRILP